MRPERHVGWPIFRALFAVAGLLTWLPRGAHVPEAYSSAGIVVAAGRVPLADTVVWSPSTAWALWGITVLGLVLVGLGRLVRPGLALFVVAACCLMFEEGLNMKAYDRLMLWQAFALFLAPKAGAAVEDGSPVARYTLTLTYCGMYGMTGWNKILEEPAWWRGVPLAYDFVERNFGGKALGIWLSGHIWMLAPMCWLTLFFEAGFPLLVWVRRVNPWLLALGAFFHAMTVLTLHVNTFGLVATAAYPVLLFPERAEALISWLRRRLSRGR